MTIFLRLLDETDKEALLRQVVAARNDGVPHPALFNASAAELRQVPGSPFAYWTSEKVRSLFLEEENRLGFNFHAYQGIITTDDFRFIRAAWEVEAKNISSRYWRSLFKGGEYSKYYFDPHLVVASYENFEEIVQNGNNKYSYLGGGARNILHANAEKYVGYGVTYTRRTLKGLSFKVLTKGSVFSDKGPSILPKNNRQESLIARLLGILNSKSFADLIALQMAFGSYEVGVIQKTPVPELDNPDGESLGQFAMSSVVFKQTLDQSNEISHLFYVPALLRTAGASLAERLAAWDERLRVAHQTLATYQTAIDEIALRLYGIDDPADIAAIGQGFGATGDDDGATDDDDADDDEAASVAADPRALAAALVSYLVGCAFGRWDIRYATGERAAPELPDPFAPLPPCPPGMLTGADGLPLSEPPVGYPLAIDTDGILIDDPGHPDDIVRRVRDAIELIFGTNAEPIERELCALLSVKELRDYLRRSGKGGFWQDHIAAYSKSRRKAPIYWLLQTLGRGYGIWIAYHRLNHDTLARALGGYATPKVRQIDEQIQGHRAASDASGAARRASERELEQQEKLLQEAIGFRDQLERAVRRNLAPDHNDGVVLTIAPLFELVPWSEAKRYWQELQQGKYQWSSISKQLRGEPWEQPAPSVLGDPADTNDELDEDPDEPQVARGAYVGELALEHVGPVTKLELPLAPRFNILTGDNGLGKTFVLDAAWWVLTGRHATEPLRPSQRAIDDQQTPTIKFAIVDGARLIDGGTSVYDRSRQVWPRIETQLPASSLVLYAQSNGGFLLRDPLRDQAPDGRISDLIIALSQAEVQNGATRDETVVIRGLIEDVVGWQSNAAEEFQLLETVLERLSPVMGSDGRSREILRFGAPQRISAQDRRLFPTIELPYDTVPVLYLSSAMTRVINLAYMLVFLWTAHRDAAHFLGREPLTQLVLLIDEVDVHLHPKWQRVILPALLDAIQLLSDQLSVQLIVTTHAPLVLASLEPHFDEERDQLFDFDLVDGKVEVHPLPWANHGDATNWLTSTVFNLNQARSQEAELAIRAAELFLAGEDPTQIDPDLADALTINQALERSLPEADPFWDQWRPQLNPERYAPPL